MKVNKLIQVSYESPIRLRAINSGNELLLASTLESKVGERREDSSYYSSCHRKQACPIRAGSSRLENKGFERDHVTQALEKTCKLHLDALIGVFLQEAPVCLPVYQTLSNLVHELGKQVPITTSSLSFFSAAFSTSFHLLMARSGATRFLTLLDLSACLPAGVNSVTRRLHEKDETKDDDEQGHAALRLLDVVPWFWKSNSMRTLTAILVVF
ncbi:hypothetical protein EDB85DRAFT_2017908 [Lactarius pseudohatsudake]|nr:hypothetical protein EDB85DRAFT_2017908 [Lactarius pseudohatsudake]